MVKTCWTTNPAGEVSATLLPYSLQNSSVGQPLEAFHRAYGTRKAKAITPPSQGQRVRSCPRAGVTGRARRTAKPKNSTVTLDSRPRPNNRPHQQPHHG